MSTPESEEIIALSDIDFLPGASVRQEEMIKKCHALLRDRYEQSSGVQQEKNMRKLVNASVELFQIAQSSVQSRIDRIQKSLDDCWQAYVDIGIKYFLNIPTTIHSSGIDDMLPLFEANLLQAIFELDTPSGLITFAAARSDLEHLDIYLTSGRFKQAKSPLDRLQDLTETMDEDFEKIETCYEGLLAAANSMLANGRLPELVQYAATRTAHFEDWAVLVDTFAWMTPGQFQQYVEVHQVHPH